MLRMRHLEELEREEEERSKKSPRHRDDLPRGLQQAIRATKSEIKKAFATDRRLAKGKVTLSA